jgi:hypoxanthine phosphoribosyltransferase
MAGQALPYMMQILLSENEVREGVARMAGEIAREYGNRPLTIVAVMTGSVVLLADLIRQLPMPLRVGVLQASSYKGDTKRTRLTINADLMPDVAGRDVLLVDDIFDTGHTLAEVARLVVEMGPRSVRSMVLLSKSGRQEVAYRPDFAAFEIPDQFVVGYGLDYRDAYRNLPYIAALDDDDIARTLP